MSDAVEAFDRTMALRIAAVAADVIAIESVEDWWSAVDTEAETFNAAVNVAGERAEMPAPGANLAAFFRVGDAEAFLRTPDGRGWVLSSSLFSHDHQESAGDNRFFQRLHVLMVNHNILAEHGGSGLPMSIMNRETLDDRRVFCTRCLAWRDLQADAEEADRTLGPWDDEGNSVLEILRQISTS